jgi:hypothetical protein
MLTIRPEQMHVLEQASRSRFESNVLSYIHKNLPSRCASLGEEQLRQEITMGVDRAKSYGASSEIATARFIELTLTFGSGPDSQPPEWSARLLAEESQDPDRTIEYIYQTAMMKGILAGRLLK